MALQALAALLIVGAVVAYCLIDPRVSTDAYWIRVGIASVAMIFLCLSFFYFVRTYRRPSVFIVTGTVVNGVPSTGGRIDLSKADSCDFWAPTTLSENQDKDVICSICLGYPDEEQTLQGKTRCCNSFLHKDCARNYWASANEIICPNCRHTTSTV
jgi:hypothetical protein